MGYDLLSNTTCLPVTIGFKLPKLAQRSSAKISINKIYALIKFDHRILLMQTLYVLLVLIISIVQIGKISMKVFLVTLLLSFIASTSFAASPIKSTRSFDYYKCDQKMAKANADGFFAGVSNAVKLYNGQSNVDMKMPKPSRQNCFLSIGKRGSIFAGVMSVRFYTSFQHFLCSANGNCTGALAGYDASAMPLKGKRVQINANTYKTKDYVRLCFSNGKLNVGKC